MNIFIILSLSILLVFNFYDEKVYSIKIEMNNNQLYTKTWSNRQGLILTPITTGIWAAERPFIWNKIDVGGRSVIARMNDGSLLVHSPIEWTSDLNNILESLGGKVEHIISPNYEHVKYALQWSQKYPNATLYGCPNITQVEVNIPYQKVLPYDCIPIISNSNSNSNNDNINEKQNVITSSLDMIHFDCELNPFTNKPFFNEVIFYHKKAKTLFMADVYWNYPSSDIPNYQNEMLLEGSYYQHICSKVPIHSNTDNTNNLANNIDNNNDNKKEDVFPRINVPFGTKLWKFGMDKIYQPFYQNYMIGFNNNRRSRYNKIIEYILSLDIEVIVPCHGDVIRGKKTCKEVLKKFFL